MDLRCATLLLTSLLLVVVSNANDSVNEYLETCVHACDATCGGMAIRNDLIASQTSCSAKCQTCAQLCVTKNLAKNLDICYVRCSAIRLPEPIAFSKSAMRALCLKSNVPEHHNRYTDA